MPDRHAVIAMAVCILAIVWAATDLVAAFERYRSSP
jgi:hypothetical protein